MIPIVELTCTDFLHVRDRPLLRIFYAAPCAQEARVRRTAQC